MISLLCDHQNDDPISRAGKLLVLLLPYPAASRGGSNREVPEWQLEIPPARTASPDESGEAILHGNGGRSRGSIIKGKVGRLRGSIIKGEIGQLRSSTIKGNVGRLRGSSIKGKVGQL